MLPGVKFSVLETNADPRGWLIEIYRDDREEEAAAQVNVMKSKAGSMRGCHVHRQHHDLFHIPIGRAIIGMTDIRRASRSFGVSEVVHVDKPDRTLFIPPGIIHVVYFPVDSLLVTVESLLYDREEEMKVDWRTLPITLDFKGGVVENAEGLLTYDDLLKRVEPWQREWQKTLDRVKV